jgi:sporulation protein YlmC with PRC-barrel domain
MTNLPFEIERGRKARAYIQAGKLHPIIAEGGAMQNSNVWLATGLLNDRVRNSAGQDLGKIEDLAIDPATGQIRYAILSFGGLLGTGDKLYPIPWSMLRIAPSRDYMLLDIDRERLSRAPLYDRGAWPDMNDVTWRRGIDDYYGYRYDERPVVTREPAYTEPRYAERRAVPVRSGVSALAVILLICLVLALGWMTYLVSTRGWDQAKQDVKSTFQNAVYAAKETSNDATLTTKVKTALSLSKRVPASKINVDSQDGVVTLRGEVPSNDIRSVAESIVQDVPGVSEVHNLLFAGAPSQ